MDRRLGSCCPRTTPSGTIQWSEVKVKPVYRVEAVIGQKFRTQTDDKVNNIVHNLREVLEICLIRSASKYPPPGPANSQNLHNLRQVKFLFFQIQKTPKPSAMAEEMSSQFMSTYAQDVTWIPRKGVNKVFSYMGLLCEMIIQTTLRNEIS